MKASVGLPLFVLGLSWATSVPARAQEPEAAQRPGAARVAAPEGAEKGNASAPPGAPAKPKEEPEQPPVVTHHEIHINGRGLKYTATAGLMPIKNAEGETEAHIFYIAYTLDNPPTHRPLVFAFNGGPGSASVWLHLGVIGPRRVKLLPEGGMPRPPFELVDNEYTWLEQADLVFIDPVGTGYSRPVKPDLGKKFWSVQGDIESVGEFIRLYLSRNERWNAPLFLAGESYGTTRAAGLSGYLIEHGVALNGILLVSTVLNFETLEFARGNDLPYVLYLPSYTSTAWYHKKLAPDLQQQDLTKTLAEVKAWAGTDYAAALARGDALSPDERAAVIDKLSRYTGLSKTYVDEANLRVDEPHFCAELLRDQKLIVGRLDSRFTGMNASGVSERTEYDPSEAGIRPPFTSMFDNYVREELGYKSDVEYYILGGGVHGWEWLQNQRGYGGQGYADVGPSLREAFVKNPYMKLFVAMGYFDLATPFFAAEYTLDHLGLNPKLHGNISTGYYDAGHMVYIDSPSLAKLKQDVSSFVAGALQTAAAPSR
ncbi:MAG TPA: peptidase S10 [Terriglobia bacterium]|nr:peptidase S10 [Terriglobia bacterium]